jgi:hypothetical protein
VKHSVNDFNRAMASLDTAVVEQNRAVEQMNYDIVDIVNQIVGYDGPSPITTTPLRTPQDVAYLMAQCAARLRILLHERDETEGG